MKVFTYYSEIDDAHYGLKPSCESSLIQLWKASWSKHGWEPVVLTEKDAASHPKFEAFSARVYRHPTSNPREYERACFLRWLAMVQVGGGVMVDYDVMNYGLQPGMFMSLTPAKLLLLDRYIPCAVAGHADAYRAACALFYGYQPHPGETQVSDMTILARNRNAFGNWQVCYQYGLPGWEKAPLVHYATATMPRPKAETIRKVRAM